MTPDKQGKSKFSQWLELLQQESWQLELIISGFAIFLLVGVYDPMQELWREVRDLAHNSTDYVPLFLALLIVQGSWLVLLVNLIFHVVLRGVWISTVGLRYVSEDIDFDVFRLHPRFDRFLRKHVISFDHYIERLEKICSIIFAFSFLLIFMLIALGTWAGVVGGIQYLISLLPEEGILHRIISPVAGIALLITSILYFIDFLTFGWIKRRKWLAPVYFPIYRFYGWVTLSFLYRPMYYNLVDNRFGRRVGLLLVPYIILIMVLSSIQFVTDTYYPSEPGNIGLYTQVYDDQYSEEGSASRASIPSKYISNGFLELFLSYIPSEDDEAIEAICPKLEPGQFTGVKVQGIIRMGEMVNNKSNKDSLLTCISQIHHVYINDSLFTDPSFRFYTHPPREKNGLFSILDVQYLERGEHLLRIESVELQKDSVVWKESARIPFWKK